MRVGTNFLHIPVAGLDSPAVGRLVKAGHSDVTDDSLAA
jgi:hypothetical protein